VSNTKEIHEDLNLADRATLKLLVALENGQQASQRGLAARLGVALGMTNYLVKRAVRKGLLKVEKIPAKRYAYYVTPKGFGEKSRLVSQYLSSSLMFFRQARSEYSALFEQMSAQNHARIVLFGMGELAEIALLSAQEDNVNVTAVIQPGSNQDHFSGVPVLSSIEFAIELGIDAVVITAADAPQTAYELMVDQFGADRVFVVPLLHVNCESTGGGS
jgi:DNA-binding MarR family transcriptional regulator